MVVGMRKNSIGEYTVIRCGGERTVNAVQTVAAKSYGPLTNNPASSDGIGADRSVVKMIGLGLLAAAKPHTGQSDAK